MLKVNNRRVITNLSRRSLHANRMRNLIAIVAIALTAMMFTSVFTIVASLMDAMQQSTMRQVGTSSHGGFKYLTQAEYDLLMQHPDIKDYSCGGVIGMGENKELAKTRTEVRWIEDKQAEWTFTLPTTGDLPRQQDELATSTVVLEALGVPKQLGATVPLTFTVRGVTYNESFILSGWWEGDTVAGAQMAYLSREYASEVAPLYTQNYVDNGAVDEACYIGADVFLDSPNNIEAKLERIITESGLDTAKIPTGANWAYLGSGELDLTTLLIGVVLLLVIFAAGYLIIFNVFYISVAKDTRYYGLLKTIGTTPRQLRRLVRRQALLLSVIGIPVGLLVGWLLGTVLYPVVAGQTSVAGSGVVVNPLVFIFAALFALVTVTISCRKPGRLAARVSPIEALRSTQNTAAPKQNKTRRSGRVSAGRMGWQNLQRNRKQVATVVASLTLSVVLLNTVFSIVGGFDLDKYLQQDIIGDIAVANAVLETSFILDYLPANDTAALQQLAGDATVEAVYMQESEHDLPQSARDGWREFYSDKDISERLRNEIDDQLSTPGATTPAHIYGIDRIVWEAMKFYGGDKPSWEQFQSGDYLVLSAFATSGKGGGAYQTGDVVTLTGDNNATREYTVLALSDIPYPAGCKHSHGISTSYMLPQDEYLSLFPDSQPMRLLMKAQEGSLAALEQAITNYCDSRSLVVKSRSTIAAEFDQLVQMFLIVGGTLSAILGFVGVLNFVNSMATSILSRRRELAMLQSVGMTARQLTTMLTAEGLSYAGITAAVSLTAGSLMCTLLTMAIAQQMWFFSYHFAILPMLLALLLMAVLACIIPKLCYHAICRETVVERLREAE